MYFVCLMPSGDVRLSARDGPDMWHLGFIVGWRKDNEVSYKVLDGWSLGTNDAFLPKEKRDIEMQTFSLSGFHISLSFIL